MSVAHILGGIIITGVLSLAVYGIANSAGLFDREINLSKSEIAEGYSDFYLYAKRNGWSYIGRNKDSIKKHYYGKDTNSSRRDIYISNLTTHIAQTEMDLEGEKKLDKPTKEDVEKKDDADKQEKVSTYVHSWCEQQAKKPYSEYKTEDGKLDTEKIDGDKRWIIFKSQCVTDELEIERMDLPRDLERKMREISRSLSGPTDYALSN
ncbi:hypothetical protein MHSWG343_01750 [Candidatus Mycoplasma haematohominis]|uniref:Uncharacterized protein n=1 Tax=Candidatus Mycoplasma haematohominis TaxID=1494318 RepID=A0A478FQ43_9MOLU|nr:hypothetical protein MHSWG343_01750 [Candidatus Mycoplasma haemohominis]